MKPYSLPLGFILAFCAAATAAQPPAVSAPLPEPEHVKLYTASPGIIAATPLAFDFGNTLAEKCSGLVKAGNVRFNLVVDTYGRPRNVFFDKALANDIDVLALKVMLMTRLHPATLNGKPVAVGQFVDMRLEICAETVKSPSGKAVSNVRLRFPPEEKLSDWDHPAEEANLAPIAMSAGVFVDGDHPIPHISPLKEIIHPRLPPEVTRFGTFKFRVLIDEHGIPKDRQVLECTDPGRLQQITSLLQQVRFVPAMKDGMPLPVYVTESLMFRSNNSF